MTNPSSAPLSTRTPPDARYVPLVKVASGGMATVFVGALRGPLGFSQLVAIKRPHEHLLEDESFRQSLLEEARMAAQIRHANVVDVRDIEVVGESIQLVMDYVEGASLGQLMAVTGRAGNRMSPEVVVRIVLDALAGLSAVHNVADVDGIPLGLVHRDISPQNILVGVDGVARVTDFGIAMVEYGAFTPTATGTLKGKIGYMAPEYIRGIRPDQRIDIFAMGILLWEALAGRRLFKGANDGDALDKVLHKDAPRLSDHVPATNGAFDAVLDRVLAKAPEKRYQTADSFAAALEEAAKSVGLLGSHADVAREVQEILGENLEKRRQDVRAARAALDAAAPCTDAQSFEDEGTTLEYKPAKVSTAPPPEMIDDVSAPTTETSATPGFSRRIVLVILLALVLTIKLGTLVFRSGERSAPDAAAVPSSPASSLSVDVPANPVASSARVDSGAPSATASAPVVATSATTPTTKPVSTTKIKPRKLPPNPYGP